MQSNHAYEAVPYPSLTFPQTHPDRLAVMAAYHGMSPAKPQNCRVLELGCGDGSNLLSVAYALPNSEFVGVDLAKAHIESANQTARKLGVSNVTFYREDLINFSPEQFGEFDFIVAHGLYSWVPDFVRSKMLEIYAASLAPNGVGYISYNVYPGGHVREMMREMMQFHVAGIAEPAEQVREATNLLKFVHNAAASDVLYQSLIGQELSQMGDRTSGSILHDELSEVNQPFYFREFIDRIEPLGLKFLCEAEPNSLSPINLSENARRMLDSFGDDVNRREQYLDFLKCRQFRKTLICRSDIPLERNPGTDIFKTFLIASKVRPASAAPNIEDDVAETFVNTTGATFQTNHSLTKAAIVSLARSSSNRITFDDLIERSLKLIERASGSETIPEIEKTASFFIQLFYAGFIDLHGFQPNFAVEVSERPIASAFARWQLEQGNENVTALNGIKLRLDDKFAAALLLLLDGSRDLEALTSELVDKFENGEAETKNLQLSGRIQLVLVKFANLGLLVS